MPKSRSISRTITIDLMQSVLEVDFSYYYAPAVMYLSNGDPGYPEESELEILQVYKNGENFLPVLERYDYIYPATGIFSMLEDVVCEYI